MKRLFMLVVGLTYISLSGCNSGPKLKSKTAYLDRDSYRNFALVGGVPVVQTKKRKSNINGSVQGKGLTGLPLRDVRVVLLDKNKKILKEVETDSSGNFKFSEELEDGDYTLEFKYKDKIQKRMVPLKGYKSKVLKVHFD